MAENNKTLVGIAVAVVAIGIGAAVIRRNESSKEAESYEAHYETHVRHDERLKEAKLEEIFPRVLYRLEAPGCEMGPPTRNMIIYRVPSSEKKRRLLIISAIAVCEETMDEILKLGEISAMCIPNHMHRCCAAAYKKRFPDMKVVAVGASCPANSMEKIKEAAPVDMTAEELTQLPEWKNFITVKKIDGWAHFEEIIELKLSEKKKAMTVCDLLFTMPYVTDVSWFHRAVQAFFDSSVVIPEDPNEMVIPKVSRVARLFGISDWTKAEKWYRAYAKEEGKNIYAILVGHGVPVVEIDPKKGCTDALMGVADQLVKPRW